MIIWLALFAAKGEQKLSRESRAKKALEDDMTDIDPVTGDWTSKYNGMRYDKYGVVKWRD